MNPAQEIVEKTSGTINLSFGNFHIAPSYLQAAAMVVFIFLLVLVLAAMSRGFISWSMTGWYIWTALGFLLALVIEGLFIASGTTVLTQLLGWTNPPKIVNVALESGREKLINVLVKEGRVIKVEEKTASSQSVLQDFESLSPEEAEEIKPLICEE